MRVRNGIFPMIILLYVINCNKFNKTSELNNSNLFYQGIKYFVVHRPKCHKINKRASFHTKIANKNGGFSKQSTKKVIFQVFIFMDTKFAVS